MTSFINSLFIYFTPYFLIYLHCSWAAGSASCM